VILKRRNVRQRKITIKYLQHKKNKDKWLPARIPGVRQKRRMLSLAVSIGVHTALSNHTYCVGDQPYLQMSGGPIGLQLTGAVSRAFMMRLVKRSGLKQLYERYIDDSNQTAEVPPPGAVFNKERQKVEINEMLANDDDNTEARLARVLKTIANDVNRDIVMVEDYPSKNENGKMAVLDMSVWMNEDNFIMHAHYEKPMSCRTVMHAESAISPSCKKSVHTQEVLRRLFNSSNKLDWKTETAPVLTDYMSRMKLAGYSEWYRKDTLLRALRIYDKMVEDDSHGVRPLYRPKDYDIVNRRNQKQKKKNNWSNRGGYIAPIFVPPTPQSVLANQLKEIAEAEAEGGIRFRIIETGGRSIKSIVQRSNPTATKGCEEEDCLPCRGGKGEGGDCRQCGVNYSVECQLCPDGSKSIYHGRLPETYTLEGRTMNRTID
jgi:hypothetical protein